jgi:hypothetical protein
MTAHRKLAAVIGALYLLTFATSIPALALKQSFLQGGGGGAEAALHWAALLEVVLALACVGTAIAFYPVGRRHDPALALGFVASRTLEASLVLTGVIALLAIGAVRGAAPDGDAGAVDAALTAVHDWAFLLGPGLLPAVNAVLFGTILYRARLVPRVIPIVGLIGAPLLVLSATGTLFGVNDQVSPLAAVAALPIALWEFGIGAWLVVRGFAPLAARPRVRPGR